MLRRTEKVATAKTVARIAYESDIRYIATSLAYYAFISLMPVLLLVLVVFGRQLGGVISASEAQFLTPDTQQLVYEGLTTASGRTAATVLSVVVLAWSGANVAVGFLTVVERIEAATERPLGRQVYDAVTVLGTLSATVLVIIVQSVGLALFATGPLSVVAGFAVLFVVLTVTLLPLYFVPSRVASTLTDALPGAMTTAIGWTVLHAAIQFFAANAGQYAIYGVLSGLILILTSTYVAAIVLMVGVVVNAVLATDTDDLYDVSG
ncbi:YihY/virulence factor BrkB family protein [Haloarcula sp. S1AR25-5A]|uniref:YihY/virulence factor BrkB family protein n=1 Tax=Haloarcula terrestris TaxID=2950533 RepID=A0AAE4EZ27_9EURY|nr:YihY/virulence factor BrkB family protein [Haloarcula terrestris]MDS0221401.1 YihY/virulence factor BrkB family protein [Haloarcula terrestris]